MFHSLSMAPRPCASRPPTDLRKRQFRRIASPISTRSDGIEGRRKNSIFRNFEFFLRPSIPFVSLLTCNAVKYSGIRLILFLLLLFFSCASAYAQTTTDLFNGDILHDVRIDFINPSDWQTLKANFQSDT